jgi:DNA-binding transcriptional MerR regulator
MDDTWTLAELVAEAASWIATLPPPKNGQVRAVPDERTVRYYAAQGLLDRPSAMRGRTAIYGKRHLAQVIAIKRLQSAGHSLADIAAMWPTLDDLTLGRLTGVTLPARPSPRHDFWKKAPAGSVEAARAHILSDLPKPAAPSRVEAHPPVAPVEVRIELAAGAVVTIALPEGASLTSADVHALRVAAAPFVAELAKRGLTAPPRGNLEEL